MVSWKNALAFVREAWFYAAVNTFQRCNPQKRERVQPIGSSYQTGDEIDVNAVLNRLSAEGAYGRIARPTETQDTFTSFR